MKARAPDLPRSGSTFDTRPAGLHNLESFMTILRLALGLAAASAAAVMYSNRRKRSGPVRMQSAEGQQRYGAGSGMGMDSLTESGMGSTPGTDWKAGLASGTSGGHNDDLLSPEAGSPGPGSGFPGSRGGLGR